MDTSALYIAFLDLDEEVQQSVCKMDAVVDMRGNKKCLLSLISDLVSFILLFYSMTKELRL